MVVAQTGVKPEVLAHIAEDLGPIPAVISRTVFIPHIRHPENRPHHKRENRILVHKFQWIERNPEILFLLEKTVFVDITQVGLQLQVEIPEVKIQFLLLPLAQFISVVGG